MCYCKYGFRQEELDFKRNRYPAETGEVSETVRNKLFLKKTQILNGRDGQLYTPNEDDYQITTIASR